MNKNQEKVRLCVETLYRYLDNIIEHPADEKYRKIRINNKVYQEKVAPITGVDQFLQAAQFRKEKLANPSNELEDFWLHSGDDMKLLAELRDALVSAEPVRPIPDRGLKVLLPEQASKKVELPHDFFYLTPEELLEMQKSRSLRAERLLEMRTKAQRERDEGKRAPAKYRFTLVRIRLHDGIVLQGTFRVSETLRDVALFVQESLHDPSLEFTLAPPTPLSGTDDQTLSSLNLVPSVVLHLNSRSPAQLKDELLALVQVDWSRPDWHLGRQFNHGRCFPFIL